MTESNGLSHYFTKDFSFLGRDDKIGHGSSSHLCQVKLPLISIFVNMMNYRYISYGVTSAATSTQKTVMTTISSNLSNFKRNKKSKYNLVANVYTMYWHDVRYKVLEIYKEILLSLPSTGHILWHSCNWQNRPLLNTVYPRLYSLKESLFCWNIFAVTVIFISEDLQAFQINTVIYENCIFHFYAENSHRDINLFETCSSLFYMKCCLFSFTQKVYKSASTALFFL